MTAADRLEQLRVNLAAVQEEIADITRSAGRDPADVHLIVVTKTFPASDIRLLHELGVRDIGENRHPEAGDKAAELADLDIVWHFIGQVQSNKAARISSYVDVVHSVDSLRLVKRLDAGAQEHGRVVTCLVQASLDPPGHDEGRAGADLDDIAALADAIETAEGLRLGGLMGVAPLGEAPEPAFERLAQAWQTLRQDHPQASVLSAGMSADFPAAIRAGATHVRVGSAVVGPRASLG